MRFLRPHHILIPLLAFVAILPLVVHGCSCGHDQPFHVQSWLEVAQQLRHGVLYPQWAYSPAWQAGEPRFVFYPPLSWILGSLLTLFVPMNIVPIVFTWLALAGAAFSMHHLARHFAGSAASLLCASIYVANPYMLFNAFERGAYAELLSAVWIPLVLLAVLRKKITIIGIAAPLALVWLTNAPAGVMATYTLALIATVRLAFALKDRRLSNKQRTSSQVFPIALTYAGGFVLGLSLVCFYLLPAAYERRYVQVAMAIIPNLRYQDNFLFGKTDYVPHNEITFAVSVLALVLLAITLAAIGFNLWRRSQKPEAEHSQEVTLQRVYLSLLLVTVVIGFLLTPVSSFVWEHLPNLKYLQFPWRLLTVLSAVLAFALTSTFGILRSKRAVTWIIATAIVLGLSQLGSHLYRQGCEAADYPSFQAMAFHTDHGVLPTDEYTPGDADNDVQRTDDPGYWLIKGDPNKPAPNTIANPNETIENYDGPIPFENTIAVRAPHHLTLTLATPETLVLNLRDYPAWHVSRNGGDFSARVHRDDGLLTLALPAGRSDLDIHWARSWDQFSGDAVSVCAAAVFAFLYLRSRKIKAEPDEY